MVGGDTRGWGKTEWSDMVWRREGIQEMAGGYFGRTKRRHRSQGGLRGGEGAIADLECLEGDKELRRSLEAPKVQRSDWECLGGDEEQRRSLEVQESCPRVRKARHGQGMGGSQRTSPREAKDTRPSLPSYGQLPTSCTCAVSSQGEGWEGSVPVWDSLSRGVDTGASATLRAGSGTGSTQAGPNSHAPAAPAYRTPWHSRPSSNWFRTQSQTPVSHPPSPDLPEHRASPARGPGGAQPGERSPVPPSVLAVTGRSVVPWGSGGGLKGWGVPGCLWKLGCRCHPQISPLGI